jgi:hypothetical protein
MPETSETKTPKLYPEKYSNRAPKNVLEAPDISVSNASAQLSALRKDTTVSDTFEMDDSYSSGRSAGPDKADASDIFGELVLDEDKKKEIPSFMINPNGPLKSTWNILILLLVIF